MSNFESDHKKDEYVTARNPEVSPSGYEDGTAILPQPESEKIPVLADAHSNVKVEINKYPFIIGRKKNFADFLVQGNAAISRRHAEIMKEDNRWFIRDLDSKNMTLINGEQLEPFEYMELNGGEHIRVANIELIFTLTEKAQK